jgi:hypothetical protein
MITSLTRSATTLWVLAQAAAVASCYAQDLAPRAYVISPLGSHAILVSTGFNSGAVLVDPTVPLDNVRGSFGLPVVGYYQSLNVLGRSANVTAMLPYVYGDFTGELNGARLFAHRSGMADARVRFAVNLRGGPAMGVGEYLKWKEKGLIGASITMTFPTGQYDRARLINPGTNRWGFKPEIGFSRRWGAWVVDWYTAAWFFTGNSAFFPGNSVRTQKPVGAVEGHAGYYVRPRLWVSFDINFWAGNRSTIDGVQKADQQRNSRIGATASIPLSRRHSVKFSYSQGAYVTFGGDFRMVTAAWQYSWIRFPR